jgi:hypothetical protein
VRLGKAGLLKFIKSISLFRKDDLKQIERLSYHKNIFNAAYFTRAINFKNGD